MCAQPAPAWSRICMWCGNAHKAWSWLQLPLPWSMQYDYTLIFCNSWKCFNVHTGVMQYQLGLRRTRTMVSYVQNLMDVYGCLSRSLWMTTPLSELLGNSTCLGYLHSLNLRGSLNVANMSTPTITTSGQADSMEWCHLGTRGLHLVILSICIILPSV